MRSALHHGKLKPPPTLAEGLARHRQLKIEITRIKAQVDDKTRSLRFPSPKEYEDWLASATRALKLFRSEERQLGDWLASQDDQSALQLLRKASALFQTLKDDETEFDPDELDLINRIAAHVAGRDL